jgi:hypothetical protein
MAASCETLAPGGGVTSILGEPSEFAAAVSSDQRGCVWMGFGWPPPIKEAASKSGADMCACSSGGVSMGIAGWGAKFAAACTACSCRAECRRDAGDAVVLSRGCMRPGCAVWALRTGDTESEIGGTGERGLAFGCVSSSGFGAASRPSPVSGAGATSSVTDVEDDGPMAAAVACAADVGDGERSASRRTANAATSANKLPADSGAAGLPICADAGGVGAPGAAWMRPVRVTVGSGAVHLPNMFARSLKSCYRRDPGSASGTGAISWAFLISCSAAMGREGERAAEWRT